MKKGRSKQESINQLPKGAISMQRSKRLSPKVEEIVCRAYSQEIRVSILISGI